MKTFKYVDTNSPADMTIGMFEMLSPEEAMDVLNRINIIANNKKLGADNFGEVVFNEETSSLCYTDVIACPKCTSKDICKTGKDRKGNQRYKCKVCGRTFSASSNTLSSYTNQNPGKWMQFIIGLLNCETCEALSKKCNISIPTALYWRLKVFAALEHLSKKIKLSGVIFADDTRIPYNFKGNHGEEFFAPRKAHSRGHQNTIKNVQRNTICVLCAVDSADHSFSNCIGFGNPSGKRLSNGFKDKLVVDENTVLVTDGAQSFKRVVDDYSISHWEKKVTVKRGGKRYPNMQGEFHIQKINSYHSRLKKFLTPFKSVASRYLPGYLLLFDYIENHKQLSKEEMAKNILTAMTEIPSDMTLEMLAHQYKIPVSNGPETELWEVKIPKKEQKVYIDWYNKKSITEICEKHKISRRKIYTIRDKVEKYDAHDKIITPPKKQKVQPLLSVSEKSWNIFLSCYRDGCSYASIGREYGISRQRVHQIVQNVLRHPESTKVKKYSSCEKEFNKKKFPTKEVVYKDFKLISSPEIDLKTTYEVLSSVHGKTKRTIEKNIRQCRLQDEAAKFKYRWTPERKNLHTIDYYDFLKKRNQKIYDEYIALKLCHKEYSRTYIAKLIAYQYELSYSRILSILSEVENNHFPICPSTLHSCNPNYINPNHKKIYELVTEKLRVQPTISKASAIRIVSKENGFSYRTTEEYYYQHQKLMRQEQNRESEPIDEVV